MEMAIRALGLLLLCLGAAGAYFFRRDRTFDVPPEMKAIEDELKRIGGWWQGDEETEKKAVPYFHEMRKEWEEYQKKRGDWRKLSVAVGAFGLIFLVFGGC